MEDILRKAISNVFFLNDCDLIQIWLKFVPSGQIVNKAVLI